MSGDSQSKLLTQEVEELTVLLREDQAFEDLRNVLLSRGISVADTLLGGLIEGEDESRYGVFVLRDGECVVFDQDATGDIRRWESVQDIGLLGNDFKAIRVALSIRSSGGLK